MNLSNNHQSFKFVVNATSWWGRCLFTSDCQLWKIKLVPVRETNWTFIHAPIAVWASRYEFISNSGSVGRYERDKYKTTGKMIWNERCILLNWNGYKFKFEDKSLEKHHLIFFRQNEQKFNVSLYEIQNVNVACIDCYVNIKWSNGILSRE